MLLGYGFFFFFFESNLGRNKETYKCNATTNVHSCATMVFKIELFGKRVVKVVEHDVANGVDGGPEDNGHTEPAVQG